MDCIPTIKPSWPAIANLHAFTTLRQGGFSEGDYASLNLGDHVGDCANTILLNRELVYKQVKQSDAHAQPLTWLTQVHGTDVSAVDVDQPNTTADAAISHSAHRVCTIMTADCLPVLIAAKDGTAVAAVHAGWKGLADGVIESALAEIPTTDIQIWLGPCIGIDHFEVGPEVVEHFPQDSNSSDCFVKGAADRWQASLAELARARLARLGISDVYGGEFCTYSDPRFFSHRQAVHAGGVTGRFASVIWLSK
jgi:YfiH family protein